MIKFEENSTLDREECKKQGKLTDTQKKAVSRKAINVKR